MLVDLHMHTEYSMDAQSPKARWPRRAALAREAPGSSPSPTIWIFTTGTARRKTGTSRAACRQCARQKETAGRLELLAGIELGQVHADPAADAFLRTHAFDLVIGSLHVMPNDLDIYFHDFASLDCDAFFARVFRPGAGDGAPRRLRRAGPSGLPAAGHAPRGLYPSFDQYMDRISDVLRGVRLARLCAGAERRRPGRLAEKGWPAGLCIVRIPAAGRPAHFHRKRLHKLSNVGRGVEECAALAKRFGFDSVTVFRGRRPEQVPCKKLRFRLPGPKKSFALYLTKAKRRAMLGTIPPHTRYVSWQTCFLSAIFITAFYFTGKGLFCCWKDPRGGRRVTRADHL